MSKRDFTLPELEQNLEALQEGGMLQMSREDYERLFGTNSAALGRLRNFVKGHECVASFADDTVILRRSVQSPRRRTPSPT